MWAAALSLVLLKQPLHSAAYSWAFQSAPQQCSNLTIQISGSDGNPPYRALIIPFGPTPFANGTEVRKILDVPFNNNSNSVSFQLAYPANSQLVAVISDASTFGSGGTSVAAQVTSSSDSSCFDASKAVAPLFSYSINPPNQIVQCQATRIFWNPASVQGTPNFFGIIPGGESFAVPEGPIDDESAQGLGTGFSWTPSIRSGTTVIIAGGDSRGNGTAGSSLFTVGNGISNNVTCLSGNSPSSTAGAPAGGSYPTSSTGASTGGGGGGANVGAIVGGVIAGVVAIAAALLVFVFFRRRHRYHRHQNEKPVDLAADDDDAPPRGSRNELPEYYQPEPFVVPEPAPSTLLSDTTDSDERERRHSFLSASGTDLLSTSAPSSSTRKAGYQPRQMRPVNIIQHDDAGPSTPYKDEPETIELPPAYTKIRREGGAGTPGSETPSTNLSTAGAP